MLLDHLPQDISSKEEIDELLKHVSILSLSVSPLSLSLSLPTSISHSASLPLSLFLLSLYISLIHCAFPPLYLFLTHIHFHLQSFPLMLKVCWSMRNMSRTCSPASYYSLEMEKGNSMTSTEVMLLTTKECSSLSPSLSPRLSSSLFFHLSSICRGSVP